MTRTTSMLRLAVAIIAALAVPSVGVGAESAPTQERSVERFLNGTDADRDAMLKEVVRIISEGGYRDVSMVPWFVMIARNAKGVEVMLLVDPVTLMTLELESGDANAAQAPETAIPRLRN
jgi:hypothetical protein